MIKLLLAVLACAYPATIRDLDSRDFRTRHAARLSLQGNFFAIPALQRPAATAEGDRLREELLDAMNWRRTALRALLDADDETLLRWRGFIVACAARCDTIRVEWCGGDTVLGGSSARSWVRTEPFVTGSEAGEVRVLLLGGAAMSVDYRCPCGPGETCLYCIDKPVDRAVACSKCGDTGRYGIGYCDCCMKPTAATIRDKIAGAKKAIDDILYKKYEARVWSEIRSMLALSRIEGRVSLDRSDNSIGDRLWREVEAAGYRLNLRNLTLTITVPEAPRD